MIVDEENSPCRDCSNKGILVRPIPADKESPWRFIICRSCKGRGYGALDNADEYPALLRWSKSRTREELQLISLEVRLQAPAHPSVREIEYDEAVALRRERRGKLLDQKFAILEKKYGGSFTVQLLMERGEEKSLAARVHEEVQRAIQEEQIKST